MKYKYELIKGNLVGAGGPLQANARKMQNLIFLQANNLPISEKDLDLSGDIEYEFGGCFLPCEGTYDEHPLYTTDPIIIQQYKDKQREYQLELSKYFGGECNINDGYIGKWNPNINKDAKIYYIVMDDGPHEIILTYYNDMKFVNNVQSAQYIVNLNGNMMDCTPEEGDVLFDNFEEASKYFKDAYIGELKIKQEEAEKEQQRIEDEKLYGKPIETLGDGTYIGQMAGCEFYYQGNKFKAPIGLRTRIPTNTIIEIKNGKVSFKDWGTPYDKWLKK